MLSRIGYCDVVVFEDYPDIVDEAAFEMSTNMWYVIILYG
jgi:hypothetical protein